MPGASNIAKLLSKAMPGIAAFFGLEWLTGGGATNSIAGATGLQSWVVSLVVLAVLAMIGFAFFKRYFPEAIGDKPRTGTTRSRTRTGGRR